MKNIFTISLLLAITCSTNAQSVGIGTSTPNSKAALEISSTTKGLLIPRMLMTDRLSIASPPNGLMVFDLTFGSYWYYAGSSWKEVTTGRHVWEESVTGISYSNGNVAIGGIQANEKLVVSGNARVSGTVDANGAIQGGGLFSSGVLYVGETSLLQGAVTCYSTATFGGLITSNAGIVINDAVGTLSLKASGVDKGFVQLSGNNLRLGTYSTNDAGNVIFRLNGADRFTILPNGNATLTGTLTQNSDGRLKKNISKIENALSKVMRMNGYQYQWKDEMKRDDKPQIGLIAQNVEAVLPQLVATDDEGNKSVAYQNMIPVLIEAIKEQQQLIMQLKKQMEDLQKKKDW